MNLLSSTMSEPPHPKLFSRPHFLHRPDNCFTTIELKKDEEGFIGFGGEDTYCTVYDSLQHYPLKQVGQFP